MILDSANDNGIGFEKELELAVRLAREAGRAIMSCYGETVRVHEKIGVDQLAEPVTAADHLSNKVIVDGITQAFPDDGILSEETTDTDRRLGKSRVWIIDPMDGTAGFIDKDGDFAVQIGFVVDGKVILGVVYRPVQDTLYRAVAGAGTWIEQGNARPKRISVSDQTDLSRMCIAVSRTHRSKRMGQVISTLGIKKEMSRGSVGVKVGLIVENECDLYVHLSSRTKQWDTCAPQIILTEAGGRCSDLFGFALSYNTADVQNRNGIVASNGKSHRKVIESLQPLLKEFGRAPA